MSLNRLWNWLNGRSNSSSKETEMQIFSKEHLDHVWDEVKLVNLTLRHVEQNKGALVMEYGMQQMQGVLNDLRAEKLKLTMKADALNSFLTE